MRIIDLIDLNAIRFERFRSYDRINDSNRSRLRDLAIFLKLNAVSSVLRFAMRPFKVF